MNQEAVVHHIGDSCYADERRIHAIHGLQLHPDVKTALYIHLNKDGREEVKAGAAVAQLSVYSMCAWTLLEDVLHIGPQLKTFKRAV